MASYLLSGSAAPLLACFYFFTLIASLAVGELNEQGITYESDFLKADITFPPVCGMKDGAPGVLTAKFERRGQSLLLSSTEARAMRNCKQDTGGRQGADDDYGVNETQREEDGSKTEIDRYEYRVVVTFDQVVFPISTSRTSPRLELRDAILDLQGDGDFGDSEWAGTVSGTASIHTRGPTDGRHAMNATATFAVTRGGKPVLRYISGDASFNLKGGMQLDGKVSLSECSDGGSSLNGIVKLGFDTGAAVSVTNAAAEINMACGEGGITVRATAATMKFSAVTVNNASIYLSLIGQNLESISGNVTGEATLSSLTPQNSLAGLPGVSASTVGRFIVEASGDFSSDGVAVTFGKVRLDAAFEATIGSDDMRISIAGNFDVQLPCETGDTIAGAASFSMVAPGKIELSRTIDAAVTYHCGRLDADEPQYTVAAGAHEPVEVAGSKVTDLLISGSSFTDGSLTGVVQGSFTKGSTSVSVGYSFDTRDRTWAASVESKYLSDEVKLSVFFAEQSDSCTEQGTEGGGSFWVKLNRGELMGSVRALQRCGQYAEDRGSYLLSASAGGVKGEVRFGESDRGAGARDDAAAVNFPAMEVKAADLELRASACAAGADFATCAWSGELTLVEGRVLVDDALSLNVASAKVLFKIDIGGTTTLTSARGEAELSYTAAPVSIRGAVAVVMPCGVNDTPLFTGKLSLDVAAGAFDLDGATAEVTYDCVGKTLSVEGRVESVEVGPAALTDVTVSLVLWNNLTYFEGNITGSMILGHIFKGGGLPGLDVGTSTDSDVNAASSEDELSSAVTLSLKKDASGLQIGHLAGRLSFFKEIRSDPGASMQMWLKLSGVAEFEYPCTSGNRITATTSMSGDVFGKFTFDGINGTMLYNCGVLAPGVPRLMVNFEAEDVMLNGLQVKHAHLEALAFPSGNSGRMMLQGAVSAQAFLEGKTSGTGAELQYSFDSLSGSWSTAVSLKYTNEDIMVSIAFVAASECTPVGTSGIGIIIARIGDEGQIRGAVTAVKRCGEYAATNGTYDITAQVTGNMRFGGVIVVMKDGSLALQSGLEAAHFQAEPEFADYTWNGSVVVGLAEVTIDAADLTLSGSVEVSFTVSLGHPRISSFKGDVHLKYATGPVSIWGRVQLTPPCDSGGPLFSGIVSLNANVGLVNVEGASTEVSYNCMDQILTVAGRIESLKIGPATVADVEINLLLWNKLIYFAGNISGTINFGDLMPNKLPDMPTDDKVTSTASLSVRRDALGLSVGELHLAVLVNVTVRGPDMSFGVVGTLDVVYPCEEEDVLSGSAIFSANIGTDLQVDSLSAKVLYTCGNITSPGTPRWTVDVYAVEGRLIKIGGVEVRDFVIGGSYYPAGSAKAYGPSSTRDDGFSGYVSGSVAASSVNSVVAYQFDTRDGSWAASAALTYTSELLDATVMFEATSSCTMDGTRGSGSIALHIGDEGEIHGAVSAVRRCGDYAIAAGTYDITAQVIGDIRFGSDRVVIKKSLLKLHAGVAESRYAPQSEPGFADYPWMGQLNAAVEVVFNGIGLTAAGSVVMSVNIVGGRPRMDMFEGTLMFELERKPIALHGEVVVVMPCGVNDTPLFTGKLSLDVAAGAFDLDGAAAEVTYDCVGKTLSVEGRVESVEVGPATLTDVTVSLVLWNNLTYFEGNITGSISLSKLQRQGAMPDGGGRSGGGISATAKMSISKDQNGIIVGQLVIRVDVNMRVGSKGMMFGLVGSLEAVYPCLTNMTCRGTATFSADVPGTLELSSLKADVTYHCGNISAVLPRWQFNVWSVDPVHVGMVTLSDFQLAGDIFDVGVVGLVTGTVSTELGGGDFGAMTGFSFDTRGNKTEWEAAAGFSYSTDGFTLNVLFKYANYCREEGVKGRGLIAVNLGDTEDAGKITGTIEGVRRCGEYAVHDGIFDFSAAVTGKIILGGAGVIITVTTAELTLHAEESLPRYDDPFDADSSGSVPTAALGQQESSPSSSSSTAAEDAAASRRDQDSAYDAMQFTSYEWYGTFEGKVSVKISALDSTVAASVYASAVYDETGPTLTNLTLDIPSLTYSTDDELLKVSGSGRLSVPCVGDAHLVTAFVSVELNFPTIVLEDGYGKFTASCGGKEFRIQAGATKLVVAGKSITNIKLDAKVVRAASTLAVAATQPQPDETGSSLVDTSVLGQSQPAGINVTYVEGSLEGTFTSGDGGVTTSGFFMFSTLTGAFTAGLKLTLDKPPLYLEIEAQTGNEAACESLGEEGNFIRGFIEVNMAPDIFFNGRVQGNSYCKDAEIVTALRYVVRLAIDEAIFMDGKIKLTGVTVEARGYGAKNNNVTSQPTQLRAMLWEIDVEGAIGSGFEAGAFAVAAQGTFNVQLRRDPTLGNLELEKVAVNATASASFGPVDKPTVKFDAQTLYTYPCVTQFTGSAALELHLGPVDVSSLIATILVYCPGMDPFERKQRAFDVSAGLETGKTILANFGDFGTITISELTLVMHATDSDVVAPGISASTWFPLPSMSAVNIEGTICAKVLAEFGVEDFGAGATLGLDAWFRRSADGALSVENAKAAGIETVNIASPPTSFPAGSPDSTASSPYLSDPVSSMSSTSATLAVDTTTDDTAALPLAGVDSSAIEYDINVTIFVFFDYVSDDVEIHLNGRAAYPCNEEGVSAQGRFDVSKPGILELRSVVSGTKYCNGLGPKDPKNPDGDMTLAWEVFATVESCLVADTVEMTNTKVSIMMYSADAANATKSTNTTSRLDGEFLGTADLSKMISMVGGISSGSGATVSVNGKFTWSPASGFALDGSVYVDINIDIAFGQGVVQGQASFAIPCDPDLGVTGSVWVDLDDPLPELEANGTLYATCGWEHISIGLSVDTFEVAEGIVLAETNVLLNLTKTPLGTWDILGHLDSGVSAAMGEFSELQITGLVIIESGMQVAEAADAAATADPVSGAGDDETDLDANGWGPPSSEAVAGTTAISASPTSETSQPAGIRRLLLYNEDGSVLTCCNANSGDSGIKPGNCCDPTSLKVVEGTQCMSSMWCETAMVSCETAVRDIPKSKRCTDLLQSPPPPSPPQPQPPFPPPHVEDRSERLPSPSLSTSYTNSIGGVVADTNATDLTRYYNLDAEIRIAYADGGFSMNAVAEVHFAEQGCDDIQMTGMVTVTLTDPALEADGIVTVYCPGQDGGRRFEMNVTMDSFQVHKDFEVRDAYFYVNATKSGGSSGWGQGLMLEGETRGTLVFNSATSSDGESMPSIADANRIGAAVTTTAKVTFIKRACSAGAQMSTNATLGATQQSTEEITSSSDHVHVGRECDSKFTVKKSELDIDVLVQKGGGGDSDSNNIPAVTVAGRGSFVYPCRENDVVTLIGVINIHMGEYDVSDLKVGMKAYCGLGEDSLRPVAKVWARSNEPLKLGPVTMEKLTMDIHVFRGASGNHSIDVAGTFNGVLKLGSGSLTAVLGDQLHPAHSGQVARLGGWTFSVDVLVDTRTNEFDLGINIVFENEMMVAKLSMVYNSNCGPGDAQTISGSLYFKEGQKVEGFADVVGQRLCGENGTASGYSLTLDMPQLKVKLSDSVSFVIKNVKADLQMGNHVGYNETDNTTMIIDPWASEMSNADAAYTANADSSAIGGLGFVTETVSAARLGVGDASHAMNTTTSTKKMPWRLDVSGTIRVTEVLPMPSIPMEQVDPDGTSPDDGNSMSMSAGAVVSKCLTCPSITLESAFVQFDFKYSTADEPGETPMFMVEGKARVDYPCYHGEKAYATATAEVHLNDEIDIFAKAGIDFYCQAELDDPRFTVYVNTTEPINIKMVTIEAVSITGDAYYHGATALKKWSYSGTIEGTVRYEKEGFSVGGSATFTFRTLEGDIRATINVQVQMDDLQIWVNAEYAHGDLCDPIHGNSLYGEVSWSPTGSTPLTGRVVGKSHCVYHYLEKADKNLSPKVVGDVVLAYLDGSDAAEVNAMTKDLSEGYDVELEEEAAKTASHEETLNVATPTDHASGSSRRFLLSDLAAARSRTRSSVYQQHRHNRRIPPGLGNLGDLKRKFQGTRIGRHAASIRSRSVRSANGLGTYPAGAEDARLVLDAINEEMQDYPDYEFHATLQNAELVPGLTIMSASFSAYSLGNYSTNTTTGSFQGQKAWALELSGIIKAGGSSVLESLPLEAKLCFAAVARKERGVPTKVGLVLRAEFELDDEMVSVSGSVVFAPKPFDVGNSSSSSENVKEFLCPSNTTVEFYGEVRMPSLVSYVDDGKPTFKILGLVYCDPDPETAKIVEGSIELDKPIDLGFMTINEAKVNISLHSAKDDDLERFGYVSEAVDSPSGIPATNVGKMKRWVAGFIEGDIDVNAVGFSVDLEVSFNTLLKTFALHVDITYEQGDPAAPWLSLNGTADAIKEEMGGGTSWDFSVSGNIDTKLIVMNFNGTGSYIPANLLDPFATNPDPYYPAQSTGSTSAGAPVTTPAVTPIANATDPAGALWYFELDVEKLRLKVSVDIALENAKVTLRGEQTGGQVPAGDAAGSSSSVDTAATTTRLTTNWAGNISANVVLEAQKTGFNVDVNANLYGEYKRNASQVFWMEGTVSTAFYEVEGKNRIKIDGNFRLSWPCGADGSSNQQIAIGLVFDDLHGVYFKINATLRMYCDTPAVDNSTSIDTASSVTDPELRSNPFDNTEEGGRKKKWTITFDENQVLGTDADAEQVQQTGESEMETYNYWKMPGGAVMPLPSFRGAINAFAPNPDLGDENKTQYSGSITAIVDKEFAKDDSIKYIDGELTYAFEADGNWTVLASLDVDFNGGVLHVHMDLSNSCGSVTDQSHPRRANAQIGGYVRFDDFSSAGNISMSGTKYCLNGHNGTKWEVEGSADKIIISAASPEIVVKNVTVKVYSYVKYQSPGGSVHVASDQTKSEQQPGLDDNENLVAWGSRKIFEITGSVTIGNDDAGSGLYGSATLTGYIRMVKPWEKNGKKLTTGFASPPPTLQDGYFSDPFAGSPDEWESGKTILVKGSIILKAGANDELEATGNIQYVHPCQPSGIIIGLSVRVEFDNVFKLILDTGAQIFCGNQTARVYRSLSEQLDVKVVKRDNEYQESDEVLDYDGLMADDLMDHIQQFKADREAARSAARARLGLSGTDHMMDQEGDGDVAVLGVTGMNTSGVDHIFECASSHSPSGGRGCDQDILMEVRPVARVAFKVGIIQLGKFAMRDTKGMLAVFKTLNPTIASVTQTEPNTEIPAGKRIMRGYASGRMTIGEVDVKGTVGFDTYSKIVYLMVEVDVNIEVAKVDIGFSGKGRLIMPCENMGDMSIDVGISVSNTGFKFLDDLRVMGSYKSDCDGHTIVSASLGKDDVSTGIDILPEGSESPLFSLTPKVGLTITIEKARRGWGGVDTNPELNKITVAAQLTDLISIEAAKTNLAGKADATFEFGFIIKPCTLGELMEDLATAIGSLLPEFPAGGSFIEDGDSQVIPPDTAWNFMKKKLDAIKLLQTSVRFLKEGNAWMMTLTTGVAFPVKTGEIKAQFGAYYCSNKAWYVYVGLELPSDGARPKPIDDGGTIDNVLDKVMGMLKHIKKIGFQLSSKGKKPSVNPLGTTVADEFPVSLNPWDLVDASALHLTLDLNRGTDEASTGMRDTMEKLAGDANDQDASAFQKMFRQFLSPEKLANMPVVIPLSLPACIQLAVGDDEGKGFPLNDDGDMRLFSFTLKACLGMSVSIEAEIVLEFDLPKDQDDKKNKEPSQILVLAAGIKLEASPTGVSLEFWLAALLKGDSQIWVNPFGALPKIGIIFPMGVGLGIKIMFSGAIFPFYFEFEAGFIGCASKIYKRGEAGPITTPTKLPEGAPTAPSPLLDSAIPGLDDYYCGPDGDFEDPYGEDPTVFKIAIFARTEPLPPKFAFLLIMRNIFLVRLILIFFPFIKGPFRDFLVNFKDVFDLISCKKFDISLNTMPFPIFTRGGTEIKSGILIDIEDFNFFHIIKMKRVFIHVQFVPPSVEANIMIDPFEFKVGDTTVLSIMGCGRDKKMEAREKMEQAEKQRAQNEAKTLLMYEVNKYDENVENTIRETAKELEAWEERNEEVENGALGLVGVDEDDDLMRLGEPHHKDAALNLKLDAVHRQTICGNLYCYTCLRVLENKGYMDLSCGTPENVITGVDYAAWGVANTQPDWDFTSQPGLCGMVRGIFRFQSRYVTHKY